MDKSISADYPAQEGAAPDSQALHKVGRETCRVQDDWVHGECNSHQPRGGFISCCFPESL